MDLHAFQQDKNVTFHAREQDKNVIQSLRAFRRAFVCVDSECLNEATVLPVLLVVGRPVGFLEGGRRSGVRFGLANAAGQDNGQQMGRWADRKRVATQTKIKYHPNPMGPFWPEPSQSDLGFRFPVSI